MIRKIRKEIDKIDMKILELITKRAELARKIAKLKQKKGEEIFSPHREKKIISNILKNMKSDLPKESMKEIFHSIISFCRGLQRRLKVAYLGPEATFTYLATIKKFGRDVDYIPLKSIPDVFYETEKGKVDYGVVPIENSTEGVVNHTLDMLSGSPLKICGEINLLIQPCLVSMAKDINEINKVYSHPQALAQCRRFLETELPNVKLVETSSTSEAASFCLKDKKSAAISTVLASEIYGLNILAENIGDVHENYTRFLIIGQREIEKSGDDKTSIMFSIRDRIGALHDMLRPFKKYKINLTMIESRPVKGQPWQYLFFVDFLGHIKDKKVKKALKELEKMAIFVKHLGSYPRME